MRDGLKSNRPIRITAAFCALSLVFTLASCGGRQPARSVAVDYTPSEDVRSAKHEAPLHFTADPKKLASIAKSGLIELLADESTCAPVVRETLNNKYWYALPSAADKNNVSTVASVFSMRVFCAGKIYLVDSQDSCVSAGKTKIETGKEGMTVTYLADIAGKAVFRIILVYTLNDGVLRVSAAQSRIKGDAGARILSLDLLGFFGASAAAAEGDFILLPDGCGALLDTSVEQAGFEPVSLDVYGSDPAVSGVSSPHEALVAAFGVKQGDDAFAAIVTGADAGAADNADFAAVIKADRANGADGYHRAWARFTVTPHRIAEDAGRSRLYLAADSLEKVTVAYKFVSDKNASLNGIATACREELMRNGRLPLRNAETSGSIPLVLTLSAAREKDGIWGSRKIRVQTDFEEALDILTRLKAKGVDSVSLRYRGVFRDGIFGKNILRRAGGKKGLEQLCAYMYAQKMELYTDGSFYFGGSPAEDITGEGFSAAARTGTKSNVCSQRKTAGNAADLIACMRGFSFTGFSVSDAGSLLYSDYSADASRQSALNNASDQIRALSIGRKTAVATGFFYAVKNADLIMDLPMTTTYPAVKGYEPVPFVPMLLHGLVSYAGTPVNDASDPEEMLLKSIEYGAFPSYEWNYNADPSLPPSQDNRYYENWIARAADFYPAANKALADIAGARITAHYQADEGVFCTEYDVAAKVYVNYNNKPAEVGNLLIDARSFLKIS
ncbi:MAG TPA: DUF5696 domain-containing protein [Clostridiales bacterium]|nr:DUF5696 domain-containing protein [Clostridiales bacterium]